MRFYSAESSNPSSPPAWFVALQSMIEPKDPREKQDSEEPEPCTKPCCKPDPRETHAV